MGRFFKDMRTLRNKVKSYYRRLTSGEAALYRAMMDRGDYNEEDFRELLRFAYEKQMDTPHSYDKILMAMADLKWYVVMDNKQIKEISEMIFKISGEKAISLLEACRIIKIKNSLEDIFFSK